MNWSNMLVYVSANTNLVASGSNIKQFRAVPLLPITEMGKFVGVPVV